MSPRLTTARGLDFDIRGADVPRDLFPMGRVKFALGVDRIVDRRGAEARRRRAELAKLRVWQAWDILKAIQEERISVAEVCRRMQQGGEGALVEIRQDLARQRAGETPTFNQEADRFLAWYAERKKERSVIQRRSQLVRFGRQLREDGTPLGSVPFDQLTQADVDRGVRAVSSSPNTREGIRTAVSAVFSWSIADESEAARVGKRPPRWTVNPASYRGEKKPGRVVTASAAQLLALLAAAEPYQEAYLRSFVHLGLREAEVIHTRFHLDLDPETWLWAIQGRGPDPRCPCPDCQGAQGWSPKSARSWRTLKVPDAVSGDGAGPHPLRETLERYLRVYPCEPGDFVFRNPRTKGVWHHRALADDFARLCERAKVKYGRDVPGALTLHALRHTAATDMLRQGVRESVIAGILGDSVQVVVDTYVHLTADDLSEGIARGSSYRV